MFFRTTVSMAHALGMEVVAEGVENAEQRAIMGALGCNEVQDHLIVRPTAAQAVVGSLVTRCLLKPVESACVGGAMSRLTR